MPIRRCIANLLHRLPEVREIESGRTRLAAERDELTAARDELLQQRDELHAHSQRLSAELSGAHRRETALRQELEDAHKMANESAAALEETERRLDGLQRQLAAATETLDASARRHQQAAEVWTSERQQLDSDRQRLESTVAALEAEVAPLRQLPWPPGHFYSPLINLDDPHVESICARESTRFDAPITSPSLDEAAMLAVLRRLSQHYSGLEFPAAPTPGRRYHYENPNFSYADAITLACFLLELRPGRYFEVGAGYSSCAAMDTNDRYLAGATDIRVIDPYPETLLDLLRPEDPYRERIIPQSLQSLPLAFFEDLEPNDVLFIDSSHVAKTGSDVVDYLFRILPALQPGVLIGIHDILYPFEYPASWITTHRRSWNETYLLRAFLQYNTAFEVVYFNDLVYNKHAALTRELMPLCRENSGGTIWLTRNR